jgi:hypothetical protein
LMAHAQSFGERRTTAEQLFNPFSITSFVVT